MMSSTLESTINTKAIRKGMVLVLRKRDIFWYRPPAAEASSFWNSRVSKSRMPIAANAPETLTVITAVVIVEDMVSSLYDRTLPE